MRLGAMLCLKLRGKDAAEKPREVCHLLLERCFLSQHTHAVLLNSFLFLSHILAETIYRRKTQNQAMCRYADSLHLVGI